jgi:hypothetical protein
LYFSLALLTFLTVHGLLLAKVEPVATYFFVFVWWSYIFLIDSIILWGRGSSLISRLKGKFPLLILCSACFWIFFELLNLGLNNWYYQGQGGSFSLPILIFFGLLAFGSVLPGILETHELLQLIGLGKRLEFLGWEKSSKLLRWKWWGRPGYLWIIAGIAMIAASLIWPRYFFWMIWLAVIFILDPQVEKQGGESILSQLKKGSVRTFYRLLLTGLVCGILWEAWNYWAGLKWIYNVPFIGKWKIFEMPILGYLGFTVFAVECYVFYQWLGCQKTRLVRIVKLNGGKNDPKV